jgi:hypothetical protein
MAGDVDNTARERLFQALLEGQNNTQAAASSGYSRKHVKDLLKNPAFVRELERRREALPKAEAQPDPDEELALKTAREVAGDPEQPGTARVAAAKALFERVDKRKTPKATPVNQDRTEVAEPKRAKETPAEAAARFGIKLA